MCLWKTSIKAKKAAGQLDKWADALNGLEQGWTGGSIPNSTLPQIYSVLTTGIPPPPPITTITLQILLVGSKTLMLHRQTLMQLR